MVLVFGEQKFLYMYLLEKNNLLGKDGPWIADEVACSASQGQMDVV